MKIFRNLISTVLIAALTAGFVPQLLPNSAVHADSTKNQDNTRLGTYGIGSPEVPTTNTGWSGSYVYFGSFEGDPIKFRVLSPKTSVYGGTTMFLDCDSLLFKSEFDKNTSTQLWVWNSTSVWEESDLRTILNGSFFSDSFTEQESNAIALSTGTGTLTSYASGSAIEAVCAKPVSVNDKVFLLDASEVSNPDYGYYPEINWTFTGIYWQISFSRDINESFVKIFSSSPNNWVYTDSPKQWWWTRNYFSDSGDFDEGDASTAVYYDGLSVASPHEIGGVSPALNVSLDSILFSTKLSGEWSEAGSEYSLTIIDENLGIELTGDQKATLDGSTVTVPYQVTGNDADSANRVSFLILDDEYEAGNANDAQILYYDAFENTFELPDDLDVSDWGVDYYVYILAENVKGDYETDYASIPVELDAPEAVVPEDNSTPNPAPKSNSESEDVKITSGTAHVQDIGNVTAYAEENGFLYLGTEGQGKRLESITLNFENPTSYSGTLEYRVHVQDIGWTDWVTAGNPAGTEGQSKRIEAIEIRLTGELADYYSVFYGVHIQDYGDMQGFVQDGALAGTTGESKRIEALTVIIAPKGAVDDISVCYRVHVQDYGWEKSYASNGEMAGTSGESKRLEGIEIYLTSCPYSGGIQYKTHVQDYGWESSWTKSGEMSGTQGESKRLEGICIELYGEVAEYYDIYYRVHAQDIGWMGWAKNGECAGTAGRSARLEGIQIVLVPKGGPAPAATYEGITAVTEQAFVEGF